MAIHVENYYRDYGPMVLRRCRQMLRDEEKAVDAMQDVFVQLLRNQDRLNHQAPSSLLYRIATNTCLNRIRGEGRCAEDSDDLIERIASAEDAAARNRARSVLRRLFGAEKESTGTIAVLHLVDGMTLEEVATEVDMSVSGVRKRLRRLRGRLVELEGIS